MHPIRLQVLKHLEPLVGLKLSAARKAATMRVLHFGRIRKIEDGTVGDFALHIQCPWRIEGPEGILTGSNDLRYPIEKGEDFDWDKWDYFRDGNMQDKYLADLFQGDDPEIGMFNATNQLVVEKIQADSYGGATIHLSGGYRLVIFPDGAIGEHWRVFRPKMEERHFVVEGL